MLWGLGKDRVGDRVITDSTLFGTWLESCLWGFQHGAGLGKVVQLGASASFSCEVSPDFFAPDGPPGAFTFTAPTCLETEGVVEASPLQLPASPRTRGPFSNERLLVLFEEDLFSPAYRNSSEHSMPR